MMFHFNIDKTVRRFTRWKMIKRTCKLHMKDDKKVVFIFIKYKNTNQNTSLWRNHFNRISHMNMKYMYKSISETLSIRHIIYTQRDWEYLRTDPEVGKQWNTEECMPCSENLAARAPVADTWAGMLGLKTAAAVLTAVLVAVVVVVELFWDSGLVCLLRVVLKRLFSLWRGRRACSCWSGHSTHNRSWGLQLRWRDRPLPPQWSRF